MLTHIHISDFALVELLDLEVHGGLTSITGETGAGKSIMLDAIGLSIGDRADPEKVRVGASKADIQTTFDISKLSFAQQWLAEQDLDQADECILRRVITVEGRSRAYINGRSATLLQLKTLGGLLIDIHNQHEHQSLLKPATHRRLLDDFGGANKAAEKVKKDFKVWQEAEKKLRDRQLRSEEIESRSQLVSYQVNELDQLSLAEHELDELETEQKLLSSAESTQEACAFISEICGNDEGGLMTKLHSVLSQLKSIPTKTEGICEAEELFSQALINIDEAHDNVQRQMDNGENDAARLPQVENRLSLIYDIARKHKIGAESLYVFHQDLANELAELKGGDEQLEELEHAVELALTSYLASAKQLSSKRLSASKKLSSAVNQKLKQLAMTHAKFAIDICDKKGKPDKHGQEEIAFLISTNPGQQPKALGKVASGGELSRVSLAIQVVTAQTSTTPTLIFDEVDVGIGGTTGDEVGKMLRELGQAGQVFCVTHLAQVASKAHQHLVVSKTTSKKGASSTLIPLAGESIINEIARMMGGAIESEQSIAHAKEMLEAV